MKCVHAGVLGAESSTGGSAHQPLGHVLGCNRQPYFHREYVTSHFLYFEAFPTLQDTPV